MPIVIHKDTDSLAFGTHSGPDGALVLWDKGADFKSCGVAIGLAIYNDTDVSNGLVTAVTEDTVTCTLAGGTNNTWSLDDEYSIYKTAAYETKISTIYTDKRFGRKATQKSQLDDQLFPEDRDLDEDNEDIFGPGQPERLR